MIGEMSQKALDCKKLLGRLVRLEDVSVIISPFCEGPQACQAFEHSDVTLSSLSITRL